MDQPLVSFIITCQNALSEQLQECVQSIFALSLSHEEREIIIVDDGSSQPALNALIPWIDELVYIRQKKEGICAAQNKGMMIAQGQWVQLVRAEDQLARSAYEHCLDIVRYDPDVDLVLFQTSAKGQGGQSVFQDVVYTSGASYMRTNTLDAVPYHCLFNRKLTDSQHSNSPLRMESSLQIDETFLPRLLLRCETIRVSDAKAYEECGTALTGRTPSKRNKLIELDDMERSIIRLHDMADHLPFNENAALNRRVAQLTMDYLYQIIISTHSSVQLEKRIKRLEKFGLFPLPNKNYTKKYQLFRFLTKHPLCRKALITLAR